MSSFVKDVDVEEFGEFEEFFDMFENIDLCLTDHYFPDVQSENTSEDFLKKVLGDIVC